MTVMLQVGWQHGQVEIAAEAEETVHQPQRPHGGHPHHSAPGDRAVAHWWPALLRPVSISFRSSRLTFGMSSGLLRNQRQNPAH